MGSVKIGVGGPVGSGKTLLIEKINRKGGQGMIKSDLFIINKADLAPYVGASLTVMELIRRPFGESSLLFLQFKGT